MDGYFFRVGLGLYTGAYIRGGIIFVGLLSGLGLFAWGLLEVGLKLGYHRRGLYSGAYI